MENSLASLKSLPCPAGDECTAFMCLFGHARDNIKSDSSTVTGIPTPIGSKPPGFAPTSHADPTKSADESGKEEQLRKRIKLDMDSPATVIQPRSGSQVKSSERTTGTLTTTSSNTTGRDSSPTLRRRVPASHTETNNQRAAAGTKPQHLANAVKTPSPNTLKPEPESKPKPEPQTQPEKVSKPPESLNPRHLKKAPTGHATRLALVNALHKEYKRLNDELKKTASGTETHLLLSDQELIVKTLDDEQETAIKKSAIYNTSIRSRILTYKRMTVAQWKEERSKVAQMDNPSSDTKPAPPPAMESIETGLTLSQEIDFLPRLADDFTGLGSYGYITSIPSNDDIEAAKAAVQTCGNMEACDRCTRRFQVFPGRRLLDGALASNGPCVHHPGKMYFVERPTGDRTKALRRFRCCQRSVEDDDGGCTTSPNHVFKSTDPKRLASVLNFVKTPINLEVPKDRAVSFDCEMGYTVYGLELIRLTVVSWPAGDLLLDILVRPVGEVLDLNTRYSGVRPEEMASAEVCEVGSDHRPTIIPSENDTEKPQRRLKIAPSPRVARDLLFTIISADTPLIGHGLENDLNATRIIHPVCIDTVILWPHPRGLPLRNSLKYLMEAKLGQKIQVDSGPGSPEGHDSAEDARAAGSLVRLKIRDEWKQMQMLGWSIDSDGKVKAPSQEWTVVGGVKVKKNH